MMIGMEWTMELFEISKSVDIMATIFNVSFIKARWSLTFDTIFKTFKL